MLNIRHRVTIDITANEVDEFLIQQRLNALGEVHSVSVIQMDEEYDQVKLLASGLGKQDLEVKFAQISEMISNFEGAEIENDLKSLARRLGVSYPVGGISLKN